VPRGTIATEGRSYVSVSGFPTDDQQNALPLGAFIFLRRNGTAPAMCQSITAARAAAQLLANALNPLAHEGNGLDVAVKLAQMVPCFELDSTDLGTACAAVDAILQNPAAPYDVSSRRVLGSRAEEHLMKDALLKYA
jgi:hypothetical protein